MERGVTRLQFGSPFHLNAFGVQAAETVQDAPPGLPVVLWDVPNGLSSPGSTCALGAGGPTMLSWQGMPGGRCPSEVYATQEEQTQPGLPSTTTTRPMARSVSLSEACFVLLALLRTQESLHIAGAARMTVILGCPCIVAVNCPRFAQMTTGLDQLGSSVLYW